MVNSTEFQLAFVRVSSAGQRILNRVELLRLIFEAKVAWEATSSLLNHDEQDKLNVEGVWKVKDIYAHLAWGERQMLEWLQAGEFKGSDWWNLPLDERNRLIYEENRERTAEFEDQIVRYLVQRYRLEKSIPSLTDTEDATRHPDYRTHHLTLERFAARFPEFRVNWQPSISRSQGPSSTSPTISCSYSAGHAVTPPEPFLAVLLMKSQFSILDFVP